MTCREKLQIEHPEKVCAIESTGISKGGAYGCPLQYGYLEDPDYCGDRESCCIECWDREIPEEQFKELKEAARKIANAATQAVKATANTMAAAGSIIKDSGDRTEFATGAVRDIQKGKGACNLMPLDVVAGIYADYSCELPVAKETIVAIFNLFEDFKEKGEVYCLYNILCSFVTGKAFGDMEWETMLLEVSKHFEAGAEKYGENNWQKGLPVKCYINSAVRHYLKWLRGDKDEPHDRAFVWNILCCIWTCKHKPELNDYAKKEGDNNEETV